MGTIRPREWEVTPQARLASEARRIPAVRQTRPSVLSFERPAENLPSPRQPGSRRERESRTSRLQPQPLQEAAGRLLPLLRTSALVVAEPRLTARGIGVPDPPACRVWLVRTCNRESPVSAE